MKIGEQIKKNDLEISRLSEKIGVSGFCNFLLRKILDSKTNELTFEEIRKAEDDYLKVLEKN